MPKKSRTHYIGWYRLDNADAYLIWYSNDTDGVIVNRSKNVLVFTSLEGLLNYAKVHNIHIKKEKPKLHDLDIVDRWLRSKTVKTPGCDEILSAWNLLSDISSSLGEDLGEDDLKLKQIYEKLFRGNNLPSITPSGRQYNPRWKKGEQRLMRKTLKKGLEVFRRHMKVM